MATVFNVLAAAVWPLAGLLTFRLLPFIGFVALSGSYAWSKRLLLVGLYISIAVVAVRHGATPFFWIALAYVYFLGAGWVAHELLPYVRSNVAWLATVVLLFWALPSIIIRGASLGFYVLGWDFTLAAYSFGVDTRNTEKPPLREFLFFLLVNPALVY